MGNTTGRVLKRLVCFCVIAAMTAVLGFSGLPVLADESQSETENNGGAGSETGEHQEGQNNSGGGQRTFTVNFGTGSWKIGEITVEAKKDGQDLSGEQSNLKESDEISLDNFNAATMQVKLSGGSDGFSTKLNVTDGKTSLASRDGDGGLPNGTLTFSVEEKPIEGGNPGGGGAGQGGGEIKDPITITVSVDSGSELLDNNSGSYTIKVDGTDVKGGSVTVEKADNHVIWLQPQYGQAIAVKINGMAINGEEGTGSDQGWMKYTVAEEKEGNCTYSIAIEDAGASSVNVAWSYEGNLGPDAKVEHGTVKILSATQADGTSGIGAVNTQNDKEGHVEIIPGSTVTVEIKPDYGYQFLSGSLNGYTVTAGSEVSTFTFTMPETNLHLSALFTKTEDKITVNSSQVSTGRIGNGENAVDSGNLKLEIKDLDEEQKTAAAFSLGAQVTNSTDEVQLYLDMDLYKVVNKGSESEAWENKLKDLPGNVTVSMTLAENMRSMDGIYYVIREHDEANGTKSYDRIQAAFDPATGQISFETNKFSTYALVLGPKSSGGNTRGNSGSSGGGSSIGGGSDIGGASHSGQTGAVETKSNTSSTTVKKPVNSSTEEKAAAEAVSEAAKKDGYQTVSGDGWSKTVSTETEAVKANADVKSFIAAHANEKVTITVEPKIEIEVKEADSEKISYEITPTIDVKLSAGNETKTINMLKKVSVTEPVTVSVPVPTTYAGDGEVLYITHKLDKGKLRYYKGTIVKGILSFRNPDGFSEFVITKEMPEGYVDANETAYLPVYRLYDKNTGEHFFTISEAEKNNCVKMGWTLEGIAFKAVTASATPVYRIYNRVLGMHFYTTNAIERDFLKKNGWTYEGIAFYSAGTIPVYRTYDGRSRNCNHMFTASKFENDIIKSWAWKDEGIGWYAVE